MTTPSHADSGRQRPSHPLAVPRRFLTCCWWLSLVLWAPLLWARTPRTAPPGGEWIPWGGAPVRHDRLLARFAQKESPRDETLLADHGITILRRLRHPEGLIVVEFDPVNAEGLATKIKLLRSLKLFRYVEPDWQRRTRMEPSDDAFVDGRLWALRNTGQNGGSPGADINAVRAWDITTGSPVVVAVIDTGIRYTHQDLRDAMWRNPGEIGEGRETNGLDDDANGYVDDVHGINVITGSGDPMDDNEHGSHCAGTIGASPNGGGPHVGVAWNVSLMGVKFLSAGGSGATSDAVTGIDYAVAQGARILSNSWGGSGFSAGLRDSISAARDRGVLFVAAAGNDGTDIDQAPDYPAAYPIDNVVAVAALDRHDQLAGFSNFGANSVHLAAPGVEIFSCTQRDDKSYDSFDGTSMAAPHVAGVAALIMSAFPSATHSDVRHRLIGGSRPVSALRGRTQAGALDAHGALTVVADGVLEIRLTASQNPLLAGSRANLFATLTDLYPVVGATVDVTVGQSESMRLMDNGLSPDGRSGDGIYSGSIDVPSSGTVLPVVVTAESRGAERAEAAFSLPLAVPPANDNFASRDALAAGSTRTMGSNVNASLEPSEPLQPPESGSHSVWWTWTAAASGEVTFSTAGSSFDTTLAVYEGDLLASLRLIASNDDAGGAFQSAVNFMAQAGASYAIQVNGYAGATGTIVLNHPVSGGLPGAPVVASGPSPVSVLVGQPFELKVEADGILPMALQWIRDGQELAGETAATLSRTAASTIDEGSYRVRIANPRGIILSDSAFVAVERVAIIPENDAFGAATPLASGGGRVRASNRLATGEPDEPDHGGTAAPLASLWWRWTAADDGVLDLNTFGSAFDTVLAVYVGETPGTLMRLADNDNAGGGQQSALALPVTEGTNYFIAVDGAGSSVGVVFLSHSFAAVTPPPANDTFANRKLVPASGNETGNNLGATGEPGEPDHAGNSFPLASLWWTWTAPEAGLVTISTEDSDFDTTLAVYQGTAVDALTVLAEDDDTGSGLQSVVRLGVTVGQVLQIAVDGFGGEQGAVALSVRFSSSVVDNDDFARAAEIAPGTTQVTGSTMGATGEAGEPVHHDESAAPLASAWWRWTAAESGLLTIDLQGSDFDTVMAVYQGNTLDTLMPRASNDDANASLTSQVSLSVLASQTYFIAVDGYGSSQGSVRMNLHLGPPPVVPNDHFANATSIPSTTNRVTGNTVGASGEAGESAHHAEDGLPLHSIWWRWTAPASGSLTLDLSGSDFDTLLAIYEGTSLPNLVHLASDDDGGSGRTSRLSTTVVADTTYYIAVDGFSSDVGSVIMSLDLSSPVPLGHALDAPTLAWTTGGDAPWYGQTRDSVLRGASAISGLLSDEQSSWVEAAVPGPGRLRFWWKIDSEEDFDELTLTVNNSVVSSTSGIQNWSLQTVNLTAGLHTIRWTYAKDDSFSDGEDRAWLDGVAYEPQGYLDWVAGFPGVPPTSRGLGDDPDADGQANILEYLHDSPPHQASPATVWTTPSHSAEHDLVISYRRRKNLQGLTVVTEWSPDLKSWAPSGGLIGNRRVTLVETTDDSLPSHDFVTIRSTGTNGPVYLRLNIRTP